VSAAIRTAGLTKTYGAIRAVVDLDLQVAPGQAFGFLGPNGAGKSTTIRMILALQRATRGSVEVLGLDAGRHSVEINRRVGYLPGDLELYPRMTGRQHIDWFARARGIDLAASAPLVERFKVVLDRPVKELSKGNRQKVGLVLAFMHEPELLILDEPTSGLDPLMQNEFEQLVGETVAEGRTVFLSSHELDEVQRLADRVAIIKDGRIVATDTVEGLRAAAPKKVDVHFRREVDPSRFDAVDGVKVTSSDGARVAMEVTGPVGPVLKLIAQEDPIDLVSRHADLDELFLDFYREPSNPQAADAS
jgi:beta-exotoxin I transport system ATP-binding protein